MSSTWINQTPAGDKAGLSTKKAGWFSKSFHWSDFAFAALLVAAAAYASQQYHDSGKLELAGHFQLWR